MEGDAWPIGRRALHLYRADLAAVAIEAPERLLSRGERARAERFRRPLDAARYILVHALFRLLAGAYLDLPAGAIEFPLDRRGAPLPLARSGREELRYSISYREEAALFGFCSPGRIGVDIERLRPELAGVLIERCAASSERRRLGRLEGNERAAAAFRLWTMKEAALKLTGRGLSIPPERVELRPQDGDVYDVRIPEGLADDLPEIRVRPVAVGGPYLGAVASEPGSGAPLLRELTRALVAELAAR